MKYPLFASMGHQYPTQLEQRFDRILSEIVRLWDTHQIHDYLSDLLIDRRGGRQGFPPEVVAEIIRVREFRELETFRAVEHREHAARELTGRGIALSRSNFFHYLEEGDREVIDLFVRSGFNVNVVDESGTSPLLIALKMGYTIIAQVLLAGGADVNARDRLGLTSLLVACGKPTQGYRSIAEALIMKGAAINIRDPLGYTPLLLSLSGGIVDVAELLVERGADVRASTRKGQGAIDLARASGKPELVRLIESAMATS